jgi:hypothetical protein
MADLIRRPDNPLIFISIRIEGVQGGLPAAPHGREANKVSNKIADCALQQIPCRQETWPLLSVHQ